MVEREVPIGFSTYRAAINGSCEGGHIDMGVNYLDQMKSEQGFVPDLAIQYALLSTCSDDARPFLEDSLGVRTEEVRATPRAE